MKLLHFFQEENIMKKSNVKTLGTIVILIAGLALITASIILNVYCNFTIPRYALYSASRGIWGLVNMFKVAPVKTILIYVMLIGGVIMTGAASYLIKNR